jgi:Holliday junction resolvase RusA-like endonuclease
VVSFTVRGKPISTNQAYKIRAIARGRGAFAMMYLSKEGKAWKESLQSAARAAMGASSAFEGPVRVDLRVFFPTLRGDADGPVKFLLDSLAPAVYLNDRQVQGYSVVKAKDAADPRVEIAVAPLAQGGGLMLRECALN